MKHGLHEDSTNKTLDSGLRETYKKLNRVMSSFRGKLMHDYTCIEFSNFRESTSAWREGKVLFVGSDNNELSVH